ncbi:hypothetical protein BJV78DRAFT_486048 [Lactifluus subvellereus]|nr:hypothetical protein BJV78DRAFT_486048 [Lactifluus subvellereus]
MQSMSISHSITMSGRRSSSKPERSERAETWCSAAVRTVKTGHILIIEGIEKAERGIMPVCSIICWRTAKCSTINLDDATHILRHQHTLFPPADAVDARFIPAHPSYASSQLALPSCPVRVPARSTVPLTLPGAFPRSDQHPLSVSGLATRTPRGVRCAVDDPA